MNKQLLEHVSSFLLTPGVVSEHYRRRLISSSDVIQTELARLRTGVDLSDEEERIALLNSADRDVVDEILGELPDPYPLSEVEKETLLLLRLGQIRDGWSSSVDPPSLVEDALEDYDLDEKYGGLRLLAPLPRSEKTPEKYVRRIDEAIEAGWRDLRAVAASRALRRSPGGAV